MSKSITINDETITTIKEATGESGVIEGITKLIEQNKKLNKELLSLKYNFGCLQADMIDIRRKLNAPVMLVRDAEQKVKQIIDDFYFTKELNK